MPNFTGALCNYTISTVVPQTTDCSLPALLLPFSLPRRPSGGPRTTRARIRPTLHSGGTIATDSSLLLEAKKQARRIEAQQPPKKTLQLPVESSQRD
ncbi:hypothetical protein J6895_01925 [Nakaseomyces glabratus]|nr:hypothetical protein J6895_01925 [Nakaseomyces glabratus]